MEQNRGLEPSTSNLPEIYKLIASEPKKIFLLTRKGLKNSTRKVSRRETKNKGDFVGWEICLRESTKLLNLS